MKKQIFKLTSILLAMVMVFTMFTIVPISAEETPVSLSEAVEDLKTAWKDLTYIGDGYTQSVPMNYFASAWQGQADYVITDATVQGGTSYQLPLNATAKNLIYTAETESLSATLPGTTIGIKDVESIYFYYKSDRAFNFGLEVYATDTSERDWEAYSSADTMSSSNSKWIPFDVTNYFNARNAVNAGYPSFATLQSDWGEEYPYISRLALSNLTVALNENEESADVSFSNLFVRADANIYSLETDFDWYDKAAAVDPATLNADYDEAEDSPKWQAFITAREAVLACSGEVAEAKLRAAAEEMITSETSYAYPSGVGRAWKERTPNDKAVDIYGDYTLTETMGNSNTTGIWMHESVDSYVNGSNQTADANLRFGDYGEKPYFVIKVNSISGADTVDIGFWGRFIGTVTGSTGTDHYSTYTVNDVKKGDELKIYIDDILKNIETSDATVNSNFDEWKSHFCTSSSYASIFSTYVATAGATANVTIGSIVDAPNYSIPADIAAKSGSDFVAEMGVLDISKYGNTEAFNSALKAALDAYPEARLRAAAEEMITSEKSYAYPIQIGRKFNAYTQNDKDVDLFGDYYYSGLIEGQTSINGTSVGKGVWLTNQAGRGEAGTTTQTNAELYFGSMGSDPYFVVNVTDIADPSKPTKIGFYIRMVGTNANSGFIPTYYRDIPTKGEYRIYIKDIFKDTVYENWKTESINGASKSFYATIMAATVVGSDITATVGSIVDAPNYSIPDDIAAKSGSDFVAEMGVLDISKYGNTEAFNSALKAALDAYPEAGRRVAVDRLDTAWQNLVHYYSKASLGIESGNKWITNDESYKVTDAPEELGENAVSYKVSATANSGGTGDVGEKNPSKEKYNEIAWTNEPGSLNASTYLTDIKKADIDDLYFYYKSSARIYARPGLAYTNGTSINPGLSGMLGDGYVLPASDGKWVKVSFKDFVCNPQNTTYTATNWTDRYASSASYEYLARVTLRISAASDTNQDVLFSDIFVKYGSDKNREGSSEWTDKEKVKNALLLGDDAVDAGYLNTAEWQAFLSARANALTYYATELEAAAIKDAALALNNELFMKPVSTISPWREEDEANSGVESKTVFGTSNNGDYYTTVNTAVIGNSTCAPDTGAVMYETDTPVFLKDIEDITFSYKVENKKDDVLTVARIWFYNEDFSIYKKDENDEIVYEEGSETPVVDRNNWQCGMEADGDTRYLAFNANTGGWVETSLATIFGDNWKTVYLGYLNESDIKKDFTEENTYISKMSFGFNTKEGASADVSVGSMYIKKTDASAYTITADDADSKDVLAQAREINLDNVNIAKANEFKKLVKAFETKIGAEVKADYIAGNWYEGGLTLKDLSVLSRKNDGTLGDTFCDDDAIGDLTEDSIRKSLLGIQ